MRALGLEYIKIYAVYIDFFFLIVAYIFKRKEDDCSDLGVRSINTAAFKSSEPFLITDVVSKHLPSGHDHVWKLYLWS